MDLHVSFRSARARPNFRKIEQIRHNPATFDNPQSLHIFPSVASAGQMRETDQDEVGLDDGIRSADILGE